MSTLTKEWLLKTIAELEEERDAVPGVVNEDAVMALASLEAEAVAYVMADDLKDSSIISTPAYRDLGEAMERTVGDVVALYTAPPAKVSVPDEVSWEDVPEEITEDDIALASAWAHGFNQCRSAILQGAEPVATAYKLHDGWVACSERMPEEDGNYWGWWSESKRQGPVWFIKSELQAQFQSSEITHWMPLPAAPH